MAKTCNSCRTDDNIVTMSGANFEANEQRHERREKRLVIAVIISVILLFLSNCVWLYSWCQFDYMSEEVVVDSKDGGNANYIGNDGDIINGEGSSSQANKD